MEKEIKCVGFPKQILPVILFAIRNTRVNWISETCKMYDNYMSGNFLWMDCEWQLIEQFEIITEIRLKNGSLNSEDLTALVLSS